MAIYYDDIKLLKPENLDDTPQGGGKMTGVEVVSGEVNDLFPPVSHLDQVYGRVRLRKIFPAVMSSDADAYYGTHIIISRPPQNDKVKFYLFQTQDRDDRRSDAVEFIQNHVVASGRRSGYLVGLHPAGLNVLTVLQPASEQDFRIGQVLYLRDVGTSSENAEYVRIADVEVTRARKIVVISPNGGSETITRDQYRLTLERPLQFNHIGNEPTVYTFPSQGTFIYNTISVDSNKYYGIARLAKAAQAGDSTVVVDSVYCNIIPSARTEIALVDKSPISGVEGIIPSTATPVAGPTGTYSAGKVIRLPFAVVPGTLAGSLTDNGNGQLYSAGKLVGTITYDSGTIAFTSDVTLGAWQYLPGASLLLFRRIMFEPIQQENRRVTFVKTLIPYPSAYSVRVRFRASGNWYTLTDNGTGTLTSSVSGVGTGTVDYASGTVSVTLGALPDIESPVVFEWVSLPEIAVADRQSISTPHYLLKCDTQLTGAVTISYFANGVERTVEDDGMGHVTGDGTCVIRRSDGTIYFYPSLIPDADTSIVVSCANTYEIISDSGSYIFRHEKWNELSYGASLSYTAQLPNGAEIVPNSVVIQLTDTHGFPIIITDDGSGNLRTALGNCGTVNYQSGLITIRGRRVPVYIYRGQTVISSVVFNIAFHDYILATPTQIYASGSQRIVDPAVMASNLSSSNLPETQTTAEISNGAWSVTYTINTHAAASMTKSFPSRPLVLKTNIDVQKIVPRTLAFTVFGQTYYEYNGNIYTAFDPNTGSYEGQVGRLDGSNILLDTVPQGVTNATPTVISGLLLLRDIRTSALTFVTEMTNLVPGSFQLVYRSPEGEMRYVNADPSGMLSDTYVSGYVDYNSGIVMVGFGSWIPMDPSYETEPWYSPLLLNDDQTMILKPALVSVESIKYNAVAYKYIPLDPAILGLDPIRLPQDGRVPIFKVGDVVVIHNTQETTLNENIQAGQQIQLPRGDLSYVDIFDQTGKYVNPNLYSVDTQTGIITFADPLDLSEYTQPLIAYHRREDMRLVSDVQISGHISLTAPIQHSYPLDGYSYVSSALLIGDMQARVLNVFDQRNWTGEWSDTLIGDQCAANYNIVDYPIIVTNDGAVTERWALVFTSNSGFNIIGERLGVIGTGTIGSDCAPINPVTGKPYFRIRAEGWGSGWAYNNVLRFNTIAAHTHVWIGRTTLQGADLETPYSCIVQVRGDAE